MRLPYMRVAIYVLTFLTYAYTGYGSNLISNLRDAIIAAEAVFGDVFNNLINVARKFQSVHEVLDAAVEENCIFKCPGDVTPVPNKHYVPSSDGCGSLGLGISTEYLPAAEMATCCDSHDICYDTCNKDKELCDLDFKRCLYQYCDTYEKSAAGDLFVKGCKGAAKMLFTGTVTLGCKSYLASQERACYCAGQPGSKRDNKNRQNYYPNNNNQKYQKNGKAPNYGWKDAKDL